MKKYIIIIIFTLFLQIIISFYTTNNLVSQSQQYQDNINLYKKLLKKNQQLQNNYSHLSSKTNLKKNIDQKGLYPIQKTIDINQ